MPIRDEITSTTVVHEVEFTAEEIEKAVQKMYGLPKHAKIEITIPCGGNYSGMTLELDQFNSISSTYKKIT